MDVSKQPVPVVATERLVDQLEILDIHHRKRIGFRRGGTDQLLRVEVKLGLAQASRHRIGERDAGKGFILASIAQK